jgi:hypothetical protein
MTPWRCADVLHPQRHMLRRKACGRCHSFRQRVQRASLKSTPLSREPCRENFPCRSPTCSPYARTIRSRPGALRHRSHRAAEARHARCVGATDGDGDPNCVCVGEAGPRTRNSGYVLQRCLCQACLGVRTGVVRHGQRERLHTRTREDIRVAAPKQPLQERQRLSRGHTIPLAQRATHISQQCLWFLCAEMLVCPKHLTCARLCRIVVGAKGVVAPVLAPRTQRPRQKALRAPHRWRARDVLTPAGAGPSQLVRSAHQPRKNLFQGNSS